MKMNFFVATGNEKCHISGIFFIINHARKYSTRAAIFVTAKSLPRRNSPTIVQALPSKSSSQGWWWWSKSDWQAVWDRGQVSRPNAASSTHPLLPLNPHPHHLLTPSCHLAPSCQRKNTEGYETVLAFELIFLASSTLLVRAEISHIYIYLIFPFDILG